MATMIVLADMRPEGERIKLTKTDSPNGQHHFIDKKQVAGVEGNKVKLSKKAAR